MINFQVFGLCHHLRLLKELQDNLETRMAWATARLKEGGYDALRESGIRYEVTASDRQQIDGFLQFSTRLADQLELQPVHDRIELFGRRLREQLSLSDFFSEVRALRETFEQNLNFKYFYRYPQNKAVVLLKFEHDWKLVIESFPLAKADAFAAVDCWALGHDTASVFHLMRLAEHGLRALARERSVRIPKRPLEWAEWQNIIEAIRSKIDAIAKKGRGPKRGAALEFYRGALMSFEGFKDAFRNDVMHARKSYTEPEATAIRDHVYHFMHRLAEKTDENGTRIKWAKI
jgi:hypothetical protein